MRERIRCLLVVLVIHVLGAPSLAALPGASDQVPTVIQLPGRFIALRAAAQATSPVLESLRRELEIARAGYEGSLGALDGITTSIVVPVQSNGTRLSGGIGLSLRKRLGNTVAEASVGALADYPWGGEPAAGPALALSLRYVLDDDEQVARVKAEYALAQAEAAFTEAIKSWSLELLEAYGAVEVGQLEADIQQKRLDLARARHDAAVRRHEQGALASAALYEAKLAVTLAEDALETAEIAVETARDRLRRLTGLPQPLSASAGPYEERRIDRAPDDGDEEAWIQLALSNRPELALADQAVALAAAELEAAQRRAGLTGEVRAGVTFPKDSKPADPVWEWFVGANWTMPLQDPALTQAVLQSTLRLEQRRAERSTLEDSIRSEVSLAYREFARAKRHYLRTSEDVEHAAMLRQVVEDGMRAGIYTESDVAEAAIRVAEAELAAIRAYYDMVTKQLSLWFAAGRDVAW